MYHVCVLMYNACIIFFWRQYIQFNSIIQLETPVSEGVGHDDGKTINHKNLSPTDTSAVHLFVEFATRSSRLAVTTRQSALLFRVADVVTVRGIALEIRCAGFVLVIAFRVPQSGYFFQFTLNKTMGYFKM